MADRAALPHAPGGVRSLLPWAWALAVLVLAVLVGVGALRGSLRVNTDVLAMLPQDERRPAVEDALQRLAKAGDGRVVVLLRAGSADATEQAMDRFLKELHDAGLRGLRHRIDEAQEGQWLSQFAAQRGGALLADAQRAQLQTAPADVLAQQALAGLMQPVGARLGARWQDDPFNTLGLWLADRAQASPVRSLHGRLRLPDPDGDWLLAMIDSPGSALALRDNERIARALERARAEVREAEVLAAGVPLFAEAAASQAQAEMHRIGVGSLLGVFVLSWFAFARVRPRLLVLLSVGSGLVAAVAATWAVFGELHLITLVFGASLVGVAENYATSYYSARIGRPADDRHAVMRAQLPTTVLALLTTLAGYALLATTPFPGLQQVALFSAAGLAGAFFSTWLWFPALDAGAVPLRPLTATLGRWWARWPAWGPRGFALAAVLLGAVLAAGAWRARANDDIRLLQASPPALVQQQRALAERLRLPSPAQFFLVEADNAQGVLAQEEALKAALHGLRSQGLISGWQAVSDWVPSQARQQADAALVARRWTEVAPLIAAQLGQVPPTASPPQPLDLATWLNGPAAEAVRHQWLGAGPDGRWRSVVLLQGLAGRDALAALAALQRPAWVWVDKVADVSTLMQRQRERMAGVLAVAVAVVAGLLALRFGAAAWRAWVPTVLAGALTLAVLALAGQPLQLFQVLALLLLLGVGVDYGIFLLAQPARTEPRNFVAVTLAAASTWLAFGLLGFSATPALRAFGLTLGLGIALAWLLTPFFIPDTHEPPNR